MPRPSRNSQDTWSCDDLMALFPSRSDLPPDSLGSDAVGYQLIILRTQQQFGGVAWLNYDRAYCREAPALWLLGDWSHLKTSRLPVAPENVTIARSVFHQLGLPLHPGKCEGPSSTLMFLGIELDSVAQGAIHTNELDRSEIDLSPKRSVNAQMRTEIDPRSI